MYDIISVAFVLGFFALCVAYTHACDRILGPDEQDGRRPEQGRTLGPGRRGGGRVSAVLAASGSDNWTAMVLAGAPAGLPVLCPRLSGEAVIRASEWIQFCALAALLIVSTPIAGAYMAKVYANDRAPGDRVFGPIERLIYRVCRIDGHGEQRWKTYTISLLSFNAVAVLAVYFFQRIQDYLPLNPTHVTAVPPFMALNTSVSFVTNTDWQSYVPEVTVSHLTQMTVLGVENFLSAAIGLTVAVALIRGLARRRSSTIGSFWVDLVRSSVRILLPLSIVLAVVFLSQGVIDNFHGNTPYKPVDSALVQAKDSSGQPTGSAVVPGGPVASQEAIKELGTNGGGFYNANSGHPFENPNGLTNFLQMYFAGLIAFGLTYTFGKMVGDKRQGWAVFAVMLAFWSLPMIGASAPRSQWEPSGHGGRSIADRDCDESRREHGRKGGAFRRRRRARCTARTPRARQPVR